MKNGSWLLLGGGLANCLLALRLEQKSIDYLIVERESRLLGGQTWSCQLSDIAPDDRDFVRSITDAEWPEYSVAFPSFERVIASPYLSLRAESLRRRLESLIPPEKVRYATEAASVSRTGFTHVVSAEGFATSGKHCGYQKFVGWDLHFAEGHGITRPVLMDATVEQVDGYRFFYLLPFDAQTLLVEDTRYSNDPAIREDAFKASLEDYLRRKFIAKTWVKVREERGSLPIPWVMNPPPGKFGVQGGFFHPVSGYSLPSAVKTSRQLMEAVTGGQSVAAALLEISAAHAKDRSYFLLLNRMMFLASPPGQRRKIFERFYGLNENLISRFYSGRPTALDKLRMLSGKPPVKVSAALKVLSQREERPVWK